MKSNNSRIIPLFSSTAILTILTPALLAQATSGPRQSVGVEHPAVQQSLAARHAGFQQFLGATGENWSARFNEETGEPSLIYGPGLLVSANGVGSIEAAESAARATLARFPQLWGAPLQQFTLTQKVKVGRLFIFTWTQNWEGLAVRNGRVQIQVHESGRVAALVAEGITIPSDFSRVPKLAPEDAEAAVRNGKNIIFGDRVEASDFAIYKKPESGVAEPRLAYRVEVSQPRMDVFERVWVDANDGSILEVEPGHYNFDVKGKVTGTLNAGLSGLGAATTGHPLPRVNVNVQGVGLTTTDPNGNYFIATNLPGPFTVTANLNGNWFNVVPSQGAAITASTTTTNVGGDQVGNLNFNNSPTEFATSQANSAFHHDAVFSYINAKLPSFTGFNAQVVNTNIASTCNAFFDPASNSLNFYASGGGCVNSAYSTVMYHEFGHGVDDFFGGITSSSLSEAISDVVAMYLSGDAVVGLDFLGAGTNIRTGENTTTWPVSGGCSADPHCAGEPFMGFAWQARKKLIVTLGQAAGVAAAENDFLGTLPINPSNITNSVTQVFILDDDDGNLNNGTPNYTDLAAAAIMKGFTPPAVLAINITHVPHPDTYNQSLAYAIYADLALLAGHTLTSATVDYSVDGGPVQSVPMTQVSGSLYLANIPPVAGPKLISYSISATDNAAFTVTAPASADDKFRFAVGRKTQLLFSNFESGASGFTHTLVTKADDWELGHPQLNGTNNYDPLTAYSGNNCWGNDLQLTGGNGTYSTNVENYLETPSLDASGHTGIHVRFRRWLTVQDGDFDQAKVFINNSQVYTNTTAGDTIDTAWTMQDYTSPAADNAASFKVQWRLKSNGSTSRGGWNVDDVEVYALEATPVLFMNLAVNAPVIPLGSNLTFTMNGTIGADWQLYASLDPGPGSLEGFGVLGAGLGTLSFFIEAPFDASGNFQFSLPIPTDPILQGVTIYWVGGAFQAGALPQISNTVTTTFQ